MGIAILTICFGFLACLLGLYASFSGCRDSSTKLTKVGWITGLGIVVCGIGFLWSGIYSIYDSKGWNFEWMIPRIVSAALILFPLVYVFAVFAISGGTTADAASRTNYLDALKTMITASGIAIAVVSAGLQPKLNLPVELLQRAVFCLVVSIVMSVVTMFVLSFFYDIAGTYGATVPSKRLILALGSGYFALVGFLLGFAYLARIPFYIQRPCP
jgi:hypothetical protein